ncbi:SNARE domain protein [Cooperia oncophora]
MAMNPNTDSASVRNQIDQIDQQLQSSLSQLLSERGNLIPAEQEHFDERTEQIRYLQESSARMLEMKAKAEEARMTAEATAKLNKDMRDLEDIFAELATIVHEQHEIVDSIEEHVERATHDVRHGNEQLKKAIRHKTNQPLTASIILYASKENVRIGYSTFPVECAPQMVDMIACNRPDLLIFIVSHTTVAAAVVGGLAVGGPVGVAAGSAVAGIAAGIGGLVAGIYGGKWFRNTVRRDCDVNN